MRSRAAILLFLLSLAGTAHAQRTVEATYKLQKKSADIEKLRLNSHAIDPNTWPGALRYEKLRLEDPALLRAFARDLDSLTLTQAREILQQREAMKQIADLASSQDISEALTARGFSPEQLAAISEATPSDVEANMKALKRAFGEDQSGRLIIGSASVLIVRPQPSVPDSLQPGVMPPGNYLPNDLKNVAQEDLVWRQGLRYAGALGASSSARPIIHCSGTIIAKLWFVTAAHCLWQVGKGQIPKPSDVRVFLPFQNGSQEVITVSGSVNRDLAPVRVVQVTWIGQDLNVPYPASEGELSRLTNEGIDIALLQLHGADMASLPNPIPNVTVGSGLSVGAHSLVGYGRSDVDLVDGLSLLVGFRKTAPTQKMHSLRYGNADSVGTAGICDGDSGGGAFTGKINGTQNVVQMIGVISALSNRGDMGSICFVAAQFITSLVSARNRSYVCKLAPDACKN